MATRADIEPDGIYANVFTVGQSALEFVFDFGQNYSTSQDPASVHTRIVTAPSYARAFWELLGKSLEQHETEHGVIRRPGDQDK